MKIQKFILPYLLYFLICLSQGQQNFQDKSLENVIKEIVLKHLQNNNNALQEETKTRLKKEVKNEEIERPDENVFFELIAKVRNDLNAEKHRYRRYLGKDFLGSNLFDGIRKACFSSEDINLLIARQQFEMMIPKNMPPTLMNEKKICWILHYFTYGHFLIEKMKDSSGSRTIRKAFYDAIGGFFHYYFLPIVKASFYAGHVKLETVFKVIAHYEKCRVELNTNGNGWHDPINSPLKSLKKGSIKPLVMKLHKDDDEECEEGSFCAQLNLDTANDGDIVDETILVALPKVEIEDTDGYLGNIWFPYLRKRTFDIRSAKSDHVLTDFYITVMGCYNEKNVPPNSYNRNLKKWIIQNIRSHIDDKTFYPGLGGVLNLYETLRRATAENEIENEENEENSDIDRRKRAYTDLSIVTHTRPRKTVKFLSLEAKSKQVDPSDCDRDWLYELKIPMEDKYSTEQNLVDQKQQKKGKKQKGKKGKKGKDKTKKKSKEKNKDKNKWSWGLSNPFKKGFWSGLTGWQKFMEIFKIIFLLILGIFILFVLIKVFCLCLTLSLESGSSFAGGCCQIVIRNIMEFFKQVLKVLIAISAWLLNFLRKCCKKQENVVNTNNAGLPEPPAEPEEIIVVENKEKPTKGSKEKKSKHRKSNELPQAGNESEAVPTTLTEPPTETQTSTTASKKGSKKTEKVNEKSETPAPVSTPTTAQHPAPVRSMATAEKTENGVSQTETDKQEEPADASKKKEKSRKKEKRNGGKKKKNDGDDDGGGDGDEESSKRLRGGQSSAEWYTEWKRNAFGPNSSSQDDENGKTSWQTFYDF